MVKQALLFSALITASSLLIPQQAHAWGQTGHRVSGAIAEQYLSPQSHAALQDLIPTESLAEISTYADEQRSNPAEFWQKTSTPWHYVTVPQGKHYHDVGAPPQGDAISALNHYTEILKDSKKSTEERRLALKLIVHYIGDLHQPLHAGNGTDRGGNDVKVTFFWERSNLHRVWDSQMLDKRQLSYTEWTNWLGKKITPQQLRDWNTTDPTVWVTESTEYRDGLYPEDAEKMNYDYLYNHLPTATLRLQQAGVRIAYYLNEVFAEVK